ncbi:hydantoinase/oxoprolinase family protein [Methylobacterium sp. J-068]|uniref:hydantoinase/oxoprolinase family protein n=1 Tax=Methylobacterium sp. J-068 TaxID=2836649 RepID=UPI001FB96334|nr:hydantoinase/oxoprolinase family protein [Methylobacterium sp. J-068]MCJ2035894.1 H4MPT-linked C1 transfer pathway protein [Methylobacterium sp. J-068]
MTSDCVFPDRPVIGWDLGGVHVKAALVRGGRVEAVIQAPCRLWRGLPALDETVSALPEWARSAADHVVTMTGELTDCFADRQDGVTQLAGWAARTLPGTVRIYGGRAGLLDPAAAPAHAADIASANWHATAALVGRHVANALLVDIGSTTADLIPIVAGAPAATGYSDAERLETGELVYTGVVRSHLVALGDHAPFRGRRTRLMAETFATAADIHRILGDLPDGADQQHSVDLKGKSIPESETRLARIIGRDHGEGSPAEWRALAAHFAECQLRMLHDAAALLLSRPDIAADAPLVVCGAGRFLATRLAARLGRPALALTDLIAGDLAEAGADWASTCGPAVAVALLAADPSRAFGDFA